MPILHSIFDNDLYKFTMQAAVLKSGRSVPVEYRFQNRRPEGKFTQTFFARLREEVAAMERLRATDEEIEWFGKACPFLSPQYLEYLRNFRYDRSQVNIKVDAAAHGGELHLSIHGDWAHTILWEVPLMSLISQIYFEEIDTEWKKADWERQQMLLAEKKADQLQGLTYADFGTRRRRSLFVQDLIVQAHRSKNPGFVGTSNVYLAYKYDLKPIGTMAHEWIMGCSALDGLRHANRFALKIWQKVFAGNLGIALTDTFGTPAFFGDFDLELAKMFDGVRHDSGAPLIFADQVIAHYKKLGIDPTTKTIVFSDGLDVATALRIADALRDRIRFSFGIGTNFTNDFPNSKALNMVIKLWSCGGIPVVKLSDIITKAMGDSDALRVARWTFQGIGLDNKVT